MKEQAPAGTYWQVCPLQPVGWQKEVSLKCANREEQFCAKNGNNFVQTNESPDPAIKGEDRNAILHNINYAKSYCRSKVVLSGSSKLQMFAFSAQYSMPQPWEADMHSTGIITIAMRELDGLG